jgi:hypothetical protein
MERYLATDENPGGLNLSFRLQQRRKMLLLSSRGNASTETGLSQGGEGMEATGEAKALLFTMAQGIKEEEFNKRLLVSLRISGDGKHSTKLGDSYHGQRICPPPLEDGRPTISCFNLAHFSLSQPRLSYLLCVC